MNRRDLVGDDELARLLAASQAEAEPALLTRVRARLAARERESGVLAWLGRPMALAASLAILLVAAGVGAVLVSDLGTAGQYQVTSLTEELLTENTGTTATGAAGGTSSPVSRDTGATQ